MSTCETSPRRALAEWFLLLAVCFLVAGAPAPHVNETHYLAKAKHYWDPSYCPGDQFLDSADPHVAFYWTVGWLTLWLPLPAVAWIGRLAAWGLVAWGWRRLAREALADRLAAWPPELASLAVVASGALWLALIECCNFAGEWAVGGIEGKSIAYGFVLAGLAAMAADRWNWASIWLGVASAFHVLVGGWAVLAAGIVWGSDRRRGRHALAALAPSLALGGAIALAGLAPALMLDRGVPPETAREAASIYVFQRLPHHLAPLALPSDELLRRTVRFGCLLVALVALWPLAPGPQMLRVKRFAAVSMGIFSVGLLYESLHFKSPDDAASLLRFYWFRLADVAVPLAVALMGAAKIVDAWADQSARKTAQASTGAAWRAAAGLVVLVWCGWFLGSTVAVRAADPRAPADRKTTNPAAWRDACEWIAREAPPKALFLVPRHAQSFKWYAARADVGNWKDVPQDAASVVAWFARCQDLYAGTDEFGQAAIVGSPAKLGTARIAELCRKYGATHVIAPCDPPLELPLLYENEEYAVYAAPD
ncbi:MAG: hypothetical protein KF688_05260 [Pirellulales bacterium]|nr:hypothetical protein [Pirellulales bacterium]